MKRIEVAIPVIRCIFAAEALERGPLHPLDLLVLGAIRDGFVFAESIASEFSLHRNIVDQIIVRLINESLVALDFELDSLRLDGGAVLAAKEGTLQSLAFRGSPARIPFHAIQDLCWGHVIPFPIADSRIRFGFAAEDAVRIAPSKDRLNSILNLQSTSIASLFNSQKWLTYSDGRRWMAQGGEVLGMPQGRELLIDFTPFRVADSIEWWPAVQDSSRTAMPEWGSLIARIRQWLQDNSLLLEPSIKHRSDSGFQSPQRHRFVPFTALRCLEMATNELSGDASVANECVAILDSRLPARILRDARDHFEECKLILGSSVRWCVIHSAFWSDDGIQQYVPEIRAAVERGVQVYLLCGLSDESDLRIPRILVQLQLELADADGKLYVNSRPTQSHAKIVAADDTSVVVSSFNFLGATVNNPQLNCGLSFAFDNMLPTAIAEEIVRCLTARPVRDDVLADLEQHTGMRVKMVGRSSGHPTDLGESNIASSSRLHDALVEARDSSNKTVIWEIVENTLHRDLLLNALHSAKKCVVITSGDLSRSAVDSVFRSYVSDAIKRGVSIRMLWGFQGTEQKTREEAVVLAGELHASWNDSGKFKINESPCLVHSKIVVVDEWVSLVSSFNFLSYRGTREGAHELGLKVFSSSIALELIRLVDSFY